MVQQQSGGISIMQFLCAVNLSLLLLGAVFAEFAALKIVGFQFNARLHSFGLFSGFSTTVVVYVFSD